MHTAEIVPERDKMKYLLESLKPNGYYSKWAENDLRNGIWKLSNGMQITGPFADPDLLRAELRHRGLSEEGYHNT